MRAQCIETELLSAPEFGLFVADSSGLVRLTTDVFEKRVTRMQLQSVLLCKETSSSLVLPAWNEAENMSRAIHEADAALQTIAEQYEIIVVDDGPMVLPVPDGLALVGDSFLNAHWTLEPCLKKTSILDSAHASVG